MYPPPPFRLLLVLLVLFSSFISCSVVLSAQQHNEMGMQVASKSLKEALTHFKSALHLNDEEQDDAASSDNSSKITALRQEAASYYNNIGVTYMRMGHLKKAKKAFKKGLKQDKNNTDIPGNLEDLTTFIDEQKKQKKKKKKKQHQDKSSKKQKKKQSSKHADDDDHEHDHEADDERTDKTDKKTTTKKKSSSPVSVPPPLHPSGHVPRPDQARRVNTNVRSKLPRISISDLYLPQNAAYADGRLPHIITDATKEWDVKFHWSQAYLTAHFGESIVDFYPHNMHHSQTRPYLISLRTALQEQRKPSGAYPVSETHPGTYIQWNVHYYDWRNMSLYMKLPYAFQRDDEWMEDCLENDEIRDQFNKRTHWRMILMGERGAGMFNHQDVLRTASWQVQLFGSKRWHICAPDQSRFLYGAGQVDTFDPDYEKFPLFRHADCYEDVVKAGEIVMYPMDFWHQTENLETPSMSVSGSLLDEHNYREITTELEAECATKKYSWGFSPELCAALRTKCFPWWEARLGRNKQLPVCKLSDKHEHDEL